MRRHLPLTSAYLAQFRDSPRSWLPDLAALVLVLLGTAGVTAGCAAVAWAVWG